MSTLKLFTGKEIPQLGLGTWKSEKGLVHKAVVAALENGYRCVCGRSAAGGNRSDAELGMQQPGI
jgi:hypothetical protein